MMPSIEGLYKDGKVEFLEPVPTGIEGRVIITFLPESGGVLLPERGIDERRAADLRQRLSTFAEDWDRPEMEVYDAL